MSDTIDNIVKDFDKQKFTIGNLEDGNLEIPPIHNPFRWWRKDVLRDLLVLEKIINECKNKEIKDVLLLALAAVLVPDLSNVTLGKVQLHFIDRTRDEIDVLKTWIRHARLIAKDIGLLEKKFFTTKSELIMGDSTKDIVPPNYKDHVAYCTS